jgi:hypothetical protein
VAGKTGRGFETNVLALNEGEHLSFI